MKAATLPADIILLIADFADASGDTTQVPSRLSNINRHYRQSMMASDAHSAGWFTIREEADAARIGRWLAAPGRCIHGAGSLAFLVFNDAVYTKMCQKGGILDSIFVSKYTICNMAQSNNFILPHNLKTNTLRYKGRPMLTLKPIHFPASVRDSITELDVSNVTFEYFKTLDVSKYSFPHIKKFTFAFNAMSVRDREALPYVLRLMPNLERLELSCSAKESYYIPKACPVMFLLRHMPKLRALILQQVYVKFQHCSYPRLEYLKLKGDAVISHWEELTDELKEIELVNSPLRSILELIKRKVSSNLQNVKKLTLKEYDNFDSSDFFKRGHFNKIMPDLEEFELLTGVVIKSNILNNFIDAHPKLTKIGVRGQEDSINSKSLTRPIDTLITEFERWYIDEDFEDYCETIAEPSLDEYDERGFHPSDYLDDEADEFHESMKEELSRELDDYKKMNLRRY